MVRIEKATTKDASEMLQLIQEVHDKMEQKQWYVIDGMEEYAEYLEDGKGVAYKAVDEENGKMAGIFLAIIPKDHETNLGYDIGFTKEQAAQVAIMETAAILPKYRGQKLQYRTMMAAEEELRQLGYRYLLCTVHPDNRFSLQNVLKQGYQIMMTKEKYGGFLRHILLKEI